MSSAQALEEIEVTKARQPALPTPADEKNLEVVEHRSTSDEDDNDEMPEGYVEPTDDEIRTLRRVPGRVPWTAYTVALVELCERFSYYGTTIVFVNFIQQPLPEGSTTGAVTAQSPDQAGALGMGQRASTGLVTFNTFWAYVTPLIGGYLADQYWGRYRTIMVAIACALVGHVILIISALPPVIAHPNGAIAAFSIGLIIMGMGTGGFKPNISPLIAEQYQMTRMYVKTLKSGERVIVDPVATISRVMMYFYMMINVGSLSGQIGMVYAEKYVGFWLSYMLPTVLFCLAPLIMIFCRKYYVLRPPTGSVLAKSLQIWGFAMKGRWSINPAATVRNLRDPNFWENVKPSKVENKPAWMTFDDAWVEEVRRGFKACTVFLWYPLYWLSYSQMTANLTSQAATMELNGIPNDILSNMNPISLIIFIPLTDQLFYPFLRKMGINFSPLKRITAGFYMGMCAMICACVTQYYIYHLGKCGSHMNDCDEVAPINVWVQSIPYVLIGISEIFASITGLEYAFTKAPRNMRSFVTAFFLFQNAFSSAIGQALTSLSEDPLLLWNYGVVAVLAFIGGTGFWLSHRKLDQQEDHLNQLEASKFGVTEITDREKEGEKK